MENLKERIASTRITGDIKFFIEQRSVDCVRSRMPVIPGVLNPYGIVQGGAMVWLADVTASILIIENEDVGEDGKGFPLAIDIHTALVGNQREGEIWAESRFVRRGRTVLVIRTRVTGDGDKLLAELTTTHLRVR